MGAMAIPVGRGDTIRPETIRCPAPERAVRREAGTAWPGSMPPALMPTVFAPSGAVPQDRTCEEVVARRV
jgi:hypothetical protein